MTALILTSEGELKKVDSLDYPTLSGAVGGLIEAVTLDGDITLWCNEEGKILGLPYNDKATLLWEKTFGATDLIMGDVILTGGNDEEGETLPLSDSQLEKIYSIIN